MATNEPEHLTILVIRGNSDHSAYYSVRHDDVIPPGGDRDSFIEELLKSGEIFRQGHPDHRDDDDHDGHGHRHGQGHGHGHGAQGPERGLDIKETRQDGRCTYLFALDTPVDEFELKFVEGRPFIFLPFNYDGSEEGLTVLETKDFGDGRFARFTYDLGYLYGSPLARHIRNIAKGEHGHPVSPVLNIPFCLNVRDSKLQASPWVVPRHSHGPILTHGGVHPPEVSFIGMEL